MEQDPSDTCTDPLKLHLQKDCKHELQYDESKECFESSEEYYSMEKPKEEIFEEYSDDLSLMKQEDLLDGSETVANMDKVLVTADKIKSEMQENYENLDKCNSENDIKICESMKNEEEEICDEDFLDSPALIKQEDVITKDVAEPNGSPPNNKESDLLEYPAFQECVMASHNFLPNTTKKNYMLKCRHCGYQTIQKKKLEIQLPQHKIQEKKLKSTTFLRNRVTHKCGQCDYQTVRRLDLKQHYLKHKQPEETVMYKCDNCDFQAIWKSYLTKHYLIHKKTEGIDMHKCKQCDYQTARKSCLTRHYLTHITYKCEQCDYRSIRESIMTAHVLLHRNSEKTIIYKCDQCHYLARRKSDMSRHQLTHKIPEEAVIYKCDQCDYQSVRKYDLKRHYLMHKKASGDA